MNREYFSIINHFCEKYNIRTTENTENPFSLLTEELVAYNTHTNLTAVRDEREIYIKHYADSLAGQMTGLFTNGANVIDIGCGAGFPGLPLKISDPSLKLTFLDSTEKKLRFTAQAAATLGMENVTVLPTRAEEAAAKSDYRERFDIAVSRAMANLPVLCELCLPFVKRGGYFIAYKAAHSADRSNPESELSLAQNAFRLLGGKVERVLYYDLCDFYDSPDEDKKHCLIVIRKERSTPPAYPRRYAQILKKPL